MSFVCPYCHHKMESAGVRPKFCSNCGQTLGNDSAPATLETPAEAATLPPRQPGETETVPPRIPAALAGDPVPQTVGPYRLIRRLGGGGMGTVYEAADTASGRRVALKLVQAEHTASPEVIERFRQEGALASKLAHPRCVFVLAVEEDHGRPYIVMELMTGITLADFVKEHGPLPPEEAIRKILDVIEGLNEAHQHGLIHRDVKPSNCFVEESGRVKIGDFGLAKSLVEQAHLTRTGTFVGTPLYASPEQIKMEPVDARSDVYSVAATLYFLLTGRAPFQTADPMASMARIVADDAPSMRPLRPELPKALDKVVLRGLERDRRRRWSSLEEFRQALRPFLPAEPSVGGVGLRVVAGCLDTVVLVAAYSGIAISLEALFKIHVPLLVEQIGSSRTLLAASLDAALGLAYFGILEGIWGQSLGKRLLRLHVGIPTANVPPGVGRAVLRAAILSVPFGLADVVTPFLHRAGEPEWREMAIDVGAFLYFCLAIGLVACTMRKRNGYRGLHEILSGTRTYRLHWPHTGKRRPLESSEFHLEAQQPEGLPERLGPYRIRGALRRTLHDDVLLGDDSQLGRVVWIWLRPGTEPPLTEARRNVDRTTRIRWLSCGTLADRQWDAFLAPSGCRLAAVVAGGRRLSWAEFRGILEDLTDEVQASCTAGMLPNLLTPDQVWVTPEGWVRMAETPCGGAAGDTTARSAAADDDQKRALAFLAEVSALALEGKPRPAGGPAVPIGVPLPLYAARLLNGLVPELPGSAMGSYDRVDRFQDDLLTARLEPAEISRWMRAGHLAWHGLFACLAAVLAGATVGLVAMTGVHFSEIEGDMDALTVGDARKVILSFIILTCAMALSPLWFLLAAYLTRAGGFIRDDIAIVQADGRPASRLRRLWRAIVSWVCVAVPAVPLLIGIGAAIEWEPWGFRLIGLSIPLFAGYVALMLRNPARAPHDYVAGTYLVPR